MRFSPEDKQRLDKAVSWVEKIGQHLAMPPTRRPATAPPIGFIRGKLDGDVSAGGSGTVSRWVTNDAGTDVDSTDNVTAYDWIGTGGSSGDECVAWRDLHGGTNSGRWYFVITTVGPAAPFTSSCVLNGYLTSTTNISTSTATNLSWTQLDKSGTGISLSGTTLTLASEGWYEADITANFEENSQTDIDAFLAYNTNVLGTIYQKQIVKADFEGTTTTYKFKTAGSNETLVFQMGNNSSTQTLRVIGGSSNPSTYLSISRLR